MSSISGGLVTGSTSGTSGGELLHGGVSGGVIAGTMMAAAGTGGTGSALGGMIGGGGVPGVNLGSTSGTANRKLFFFLFFRHS